MTSSKALPALYGRGFQQLPKPAELQLLVFPYRSAGDNLLKIYLQDLCLRQVIAVEYRMVRLHENDPKKRARLHLFQGSKFAERDITSSAENMLLTPFLTDDDMRFYLFRQHVMLALQNDLETFKINFVYPDTVAKQFIRWQYFKSRAGRMAAKAIRKRIDLVADNVLKLMRQEHSELVDILEDLKEHICLFPTEILVQLKKVELSGHIKPEHKFLSQFSSVTSAIDDILFIDGEDFTGHGIRKYDPED